MKKIFFLSLFIMFVLSISFLLAFGDYNSGSRAKSSSSQKDSGIDWKTETTIYGYPLVHIAAGKDEHGKIRVAKGVIAIGQFGIGAITIAQIGIGIIFGLGQFMFGFFLIAQFAIGIRFSIGQLATGFASIGQFAFGYYVLAQFGIGNYVWSVRRKDPEAVEYFHQLWAKVKSLGAR